MTTLTMKKPQLNGLGKYPAYEQTTLKDRQAIWNEYCALRRMSCDLKVIDNTELYLTVVKQLDSLYDNYISRFNTTDLSNRH